MGESQHEIMSLTEARAMRRFDEKHDDPATPARSKKRIIRQLMEMVYREDVDYSRFCEVAEGEPVVKAEILRTARVICAGRGNRVSDLRHAIAIIGLKRVQNILGSLHRSYPANSVLD